MALQPDHSLNVEVVQQAFQVNDPLIPSLNWKEGENIAHIVHFYEQEESLLDVVSSFLAKGLQDGAACIVIATKSHQQALETQLLTLGLDLETAQRQRKYLIRDASETLSQILVDGVPNSQRFQKIVGSLLAQVEKGSHPILLFGEMVALLWRQGKRHATITLEHLWNEFSKKSEPFALLCAYPLQEFASIGYTEQVRKICQHHTSIIPAESYTSLSSSQERLQMILLSQQQVASLAAEKQALDKQRSAFISLLTQEVVLPFSALQGNLQLAQRRLLPLLHQLASIPLLAEQLETLEEVFTMLNRGQRVLRIQQRHITTLRDATHIQAGTLQISLASCDLIELVSTLVQEYQTMHPMRVISLEIPQDAIISVWADPHRLQQVMGIYLNRALKVSATSEPVQVGITQEAEKVWVWIQDHGPGLSIEQQENLWKPLYQIYPAPVESKEGVDWGVDFFVCSALMQKQQGKVGV